MNALPLSEVLLLGLGWSSSSPSPDAKTVNRETAFDASIFARRRSICYVGLDESEEARMALPEHAAAYPR